MKITDRDYRPRILFTELIAASENLWHERKSLDWTSRPIERKRTIARMKKQVEEIKKIIEEMPQEFEMIEKFYL